MNADYWVKNTMDTVRFDSACQSAYNLGARVCLDVGPHPILASLFTENVEFVDSLQSSRIVCAPSLRKNTDDLTTFLTSVGVIHSSGFNIDWIKFHDMWAGEKISVPTYPFQRKPYWFPLGKRKALENGNTIHPLLGHSFQNPSSDSIFQSFVMIKDESYLADHKIGEHVIFPGSGYVEMCLASGQCALLGKSIKKLSELAFSSVTLINIHIHSPLRLDIEEECELQTLVGAPNEDETRNISIYRKVVFLKKNLN